MKTFLSNLLPVNKKDKYFWVLFALALFPIIYISLGQMFNYMTFNFLLLCVIVFLWFYKLISNLVFKRNQIQIRSWALLLLLLMTMWLVIGGIFSQNPVATWFGVIDGYHNEQSIWQHIFYTVVAVCAILMDRRNIKHLFYTMLLVINTIIIVQMFKGDYGFAFICGNHSGYYLVITVSLTIGMILYCKNKFELIPLGISLLLHFASFVLNHSLGPILGLFALLIVAFIYYLIYNRKMLIRLTGIILSCVAVFSFFDFVPKVKDHRVESSPIIVQIRDLGLVVLNKTGIISDEKLESIVVDSGFNGGELSPGSTGWDRLDMWKISIDNMLDFPIFGLGAGAWLDYNGDMPNRAPHNEFLEYGAIGGFPTLLLYLALFVYLFVKFRKNHKENEPLAFIVFGAIFAYLVQSLFGNVLPFTAPVFFLMVGLAIKLTDVKIVKKEDGSNNLLEENNQEKKIEEENISVASDK